MADKRELCVGRNLRTVYKGFGNFSFTSTVFTDKGNSLTGEFIQLSVCQDL